MTPPPKLTAPGDMEWIAVPAAFPKMIEGYDYKWTHQRENNLKGLNFLPIRKDRKSTDALILRDEGENAVANRLGLVSNLENRID